MIAMIVATTMHLPLCYLFVKGLDMGVLGLACASSVKDSLCLIVVMIYGNCSDQIRRSLQPICQRESLEGWCQYLKISLPSTAMICAEWWAFEILTVIAGTIGVPEQAAQVMITSIGAVLFMVPLGI